MAKKVLKVIVNPNVDNSAAIKLLETVYKVTVFQGIDSSSQIINSNVVLFTDGHHVNPQYYTEKLGKYTNIDKDRDTADKRIYDLCKRRGKLMIGFGRGGEFLNVMSGGKMIQHINGHDSNHTVSSTHYKSSFVVPSNHSQMMYPYEMPKDKYQVLAWAKRFQSTTYLDGNNEEMNLVDEFLEPEAIFFKNTNALAFQADPSSDAAGKDFREFALSLIANNIK